MEVQAGGVILKEGNVGTIAADALVLHFNVQQE